MPQLSGVRRAVASQSTASKQHLENFIAPSVLAFATLISTVSSEDGHALCQGLLSTMGGESLRSCVRRLLSY